MLLQLPQKACQPSMPGAWDILRSARQPSMCVTPELKCSEVGRARGSTISHALQLRAGLCSFWKLFRVAFLFLCVTTQFGFSRIFGPGRSRLPVCQSELAFCLLFFTKRATRSLAVFFSFHIPSSSPRSPLSLCRSIFDSMELGTSGYFKSVLCAELGRILA